MCPILEQSHRWLPRRVVESPSLDTFKALLDTFLCDLPSVILFWQRGLDLLISRSTFQPWHAVILWPPATSQLGKAKQALHSDAAQVFATRDGACLPVQPFANELAGQTSRSDLLSSAVVTLGAVPCPSLSRSPQPRPRGAEPTASSALGLLQNDTHLERGPENCINLNRTQGPRT